MVTPATFVANGLGYAFTVLMSRLLGPAAYGELGSALGLVLIGTVPALAMQPVVARLVAVQRGARLDTDSPDGAGPDRWAPGYDDTATVASALRRGLLIGAATTTVLVLLAPVVTEYLRLDGIAPALWLALSLAPAPVLLAAQGALQGREQFGRMSTVFVLAALSRLVGAGIVVGLGGGVTGALAGSALGAVVSAAVAVLLVGGHRARAGRSDTAHPVAVVQAGELLSAGGAVCGLLVLCNMDVLLARHFLTPHAAGLYAVGTVLTKAALWAPQAVSLLVFARLAQHAGDRRLLHRSLAVVGTCGGVLVAGTAMLGEPGARMLFGADYVEVGRSAWLFTATGAALAVAQLLLFACLAVRDRVMPVVVVLVSLGQVAVVVLFAHDDLEQVVRTSLAAALLLVVAAWLLERRAGRRPARVGARGGRDLAGEAVGAAGSLTSSAP